MVAEIGVLPPVGRECFVTLDFPDGTRVSTRLVTITSPDSRQLDCADPASVRALKKRVAPHVTLSRTQDHGWPLQANRWGCTDQPELPLGGAQNGNGKNGQSWAQQHIDASSVKRRRRRRVCPVRLRQLDLDNITNGV